MTDSGHEDGQVVVADERTLVQELAVALGRAGAAMPVRSRDTFDPAVEAADAAARGEDELGRVVGVFGGYLSACWENLGPLGDFESGRAADAARATIDWLRARETP